MSQAREIARSAYEQAKAAAAAEQAEKERQEAEEAARKRQVHLDAYEAALPILAEWFPGVKWEWTADGSFGHDTILWDASEAQWPPSFRLKVDRFLIDMNDPGAGYRVEIKVGDYRPDSSMPGYSYFQGGTIRSAADLGRYLERLEQRG